MKRRYDLLYAFAVLISSPVLAFGLLRTGKWRTDWRGRFGKTPPLPSNPRPTLLLHGVSVGEINATRARVARLTASDAPPIRLVVSATTNTGFARARELFAGAARYPVSVGSARDLTVRRMALADPALERSLRPLLVPGESDNLKITGASDLSLAGFILRQRVTGR